MSFVAAIQSGFRNYVNFKGRASRSEFWWWTLFSLVVQAATSGSDLISGVVSLGLLVPGLAVHVRRLHDTNRSGWWMGAPIIAATTAVVGVLSFGKLESFDAVDDPEWDPTTVFNEVSPAVTTLVVTAAIVAIVLGVINLVFLLRRSQADANRFGPPPPPRSV